MFNEGNHGALPHSLTFVQWMLEENGKGRYSRDSQAAHGSIGTEKIQSRRGEMPSHQQTMLKKLREEFRATGGRDGILEKEDRRAKKENHFCWLRER